MVGMRMYNRFVKGVAAVFISLLILRFARRIFINPNHHFIRDHGAAFDPKYASMLSDKKFCPVMNINSRLPSNRVLCKKVKPSDGSCRLTHEMFHVNEIANCNHQHEYNLCKIRQLGFGSYQATCNSTVCEDSIQLGIIQPTNGTLSFQNYSSLMELQHIINKQLLLGSPKPHYGFCIIRCRVSQSELQNDANDYDYPEQTTASQLLLLPPTFTDADNLKLNVAKVRRLHSPVSINFIMIDSLSRDHFYRSLPRTISEFRRLNMQFKSIAKILDYSLVQSVKSRTYESLQALFSGILNVNEKYHSVQGMPVRPLDIGAMFKPFKQHGYRTLWLEDLCWKWEWGLVKDLAVHNKSISFAKKWKRFQASLDTAAIDSIDLTLSSCEVLRINEKPDPFHGLDSVCYNGRHQHEYFFRYLMSYQNISVRTGRPFLSFYTSNVAHDDYGVRVQTLDSSLAEYVQFVSKLHNVLTIIFSDHGNTYGEYVKSRSGRLEMYNPVLFFIVPSSVAHTIGTEATENLKANQNRLVSLVDLHHTVMTFLDLATGKKPSLSRLATAAKFHVFTSGLFLLVPPNRTCADIPRLPPNLCICEGYENQANNDTRHIVYAEFALGQLNSMLVMQQRMEKESATFAKSCEPLVAQSFQSVHEHYKQGSLTLEFDLHISTPGSTNAIFFVSVSSVLAAENDNSVAMELISFERMTEYSQFSTCADSTVDLKLCVCDISHGKQHTSMWPLTNVFAKKRAVFQKNSQSYCMPSVRDRCLCILYREYLSPWGSVTFEAINTCDTGRGYLLSFILSVENMLVSAASPVEITIYPREVLFIVSAVQRSAQSEWSWKYSVKHKAVY